MQESGYSTRFLPTKLPYQRVQLLSGTSFGLIVPLNVSLLGSNDKEYTDCSPGQQEEPVKVSVNWISALPISPLKVAFWQGSLNVAPLEPSISPVTISPIELSLQTRFDCVVSFFYEAITTNFPISSNGYIPNSI